MVLNNLSQNFAIYWMPNTFYPEVNTLWKPQMKRMFLPYLTLEDFFNSQITAISFPSITSTSVSQRVQNYPLAKRPGLELEHQMSKTFALTVKLSESYLTYFMARQQFELFLQFGENAKPLYMPPLSISILDDGGFETVTYTYNELTPTGLSDFDLSYSAKPGTFNTFTWEFSYNFFDIWYRDPDGRRVRQATENKTGYLHDNGLIDVTKLPESHDAVSRTTKLKSIRDLELQPLKK